MNAGIVLFFWFGGGNLSMPPGYLHMWYPYAAREVFWWCCLCSEGMILPFQNTHLSVKSHFSYIRFSYSSCIVCKHSCILHSVIDLSKKLSHRIQEDIWSNVVDRFSHGSIFQHTFGVCCSSCSLCSSNRRSCCRGNLGVFCSTVCSLNRWRSCTEGSYHAAKTISSSTYCKQSNRTLDIHMDQKPSQDIWCTETPWSACLRHSCSLAHMSWHLWFRWTVQDSFSIWTFVSTQICLSLLHFLWADLVPFILLPLKIINIFF